MLAEITQEAADRYGDRPAIVSADGWTVSYRQLDTATGEAAAGLVSRGVRPGDVVALCLPSTPDYLVAYLAAARIGAVTAGVNPRLAAPERDTCLATVQPVLTLATAELLGGRETGKVLEVTPAGDPDNLLVPLRRIGKAARVVPAEPDHPVAIVFTSGTTGKPRGAVFRNRQLAAIEAADTGGAAGWGDATPILAATQFAHVGFMTKVPWQLRAGSTFHLMGRWRAADALAMLHRLRCPAITGVSPQLALMVAEPAARSYDWDHVEAIVVGGGPASAALVEEATDIFGAPMSVRYSSTESGGVGTGTAFDADDEERLTTVGRPRPPVEVELRDQSGGAAKPGEVGEVCLRSPCATDSYWRDGPATAALAWPGGWIRTGDLGRWVTEGPAAGCLTLVGRSREMYVRGGYNVFPMEVETVLSTHPGVREVAVGPRPDPVMGEVGVAVVVPSSPDQPPTLEGLRSHAAGSLARYKLPEAMVVVDSLPRTAMDKLDRAALPTG